MIDGVSALVLTRPGGPLVKQVLDALRAGDDRPDRVIICGLPGQGEEALGARNHALAADGVEIRCPSADLRGGGPSPAAAQLAQAQDLLADDPAQWVWFLPDDALPHPGALSALLEPVRRSARVGVVGPKLLRAEDPRTVLGVGHVLSRAGRPVEAASTGWVDQGQFDDRTDVLGVPLAGMLIRSDVLREVGGIDPGLGEGTEGLDLSWRAHLRGHRVVVAPAATVQQGAAGLGIAAAGTHRRRVRQVALARTSVWSLPLRAAGIALTAVLAGVLLLLLKRPRAAAVELGDLGAVLAPGPSLGARWRFRGRRRVGDRDLAGLFAPRRAAWGSTWESVQEALRPRRARPEGVAPARRSGVETGPVSEEAALPEEPDAGRRGWRSVPLAAALVLAVGVAVARWRDLLDGLSAQGYGVRGGELDPVLGGASDTWWSWALPWSGAGLGGPGEGPLWLLPVAGLSWLAQQVPGGPGDDASAALVTTWLLWAALPLSALTAYVAVGAGTRRRVVRAVAALAWAGLAPLAVAVDQGRLGPAVVHLLAPVLVTAVVRATDREDRRGAVPAAWSAGLLGALAAWWVPGVVLWSLVAAVVVAVAARGRGRLLALVVAIVPVAGWGPWVLRVAEQPWLLAGGPGATSVLPAPPAWQVLLLHPGGPVDLALWWTAPLWLLALGGIVLAGRPGRLASVAAVLAVLGLGAALLAPVTPFATVPAGSAGAGAAVTLWSGTFLSLTGAGALLAAVIGVDATLAARRPAPGRSAARRSAASVTVGAVVTGVALIAVCGTLTWRALGTPTDTLQVAGSPVPVVVAEQAGGPTGLRLLTLTPEGEPESYAVRYRLTGVEPDPWVRDRVAEILAPSADPAQELVAAVVGSGSEPGAQEVGARALTELAVGYLLVAASPDHPLVSGLEVIPGLTRVSNPGDTVLWRVTPGADGPDPARVRVGDSGAGVGSTLPMTGPHGQVEAPLPEGATTLTVSAAPGWAQVAEVRVEGRLLPAATATGAQVDYELPQGAGDLRIELPMADRAWWVGTGVVMALAAFLALPIGGSGTRRTP